jgi:hypothetical protein
MTAIATAETCDRCGAAAKFIVLLPSTLTLSFCGHHATANLDKLSQVGEIFHLGGEPYSVKPVTVPAGEAANFKE